MKDYYEIMQVHPKADQDVIKKAYTTLSKKYHPDTTSLNITEAVAKFKELQEAWSVLSDPEKRRQYDRQYASNFERLQQQSSQQQAQQRAWERKYQDQQRAYEQAQRERDDYKKAYEDKERYASRQYGEQQREQERKYEETKRERDAYKQAYEAQKQQERQRAYQEAKMEYEARYGSSEQATYNTANESANYCKNSNTPYNETALSEQRKRGCLEASFFFLFGWFVLFSIIGIAYLRSH